MVVEDVQARGDWGLATVLQHVSGGSSGAPVPFNYYGVGHWRDGRLTYVENYMDADRARAAFKRYTHTRSPEPETAAS